MINAVNLYKLKLLYFQILVCREIGLLVDVSILLLIELKSDSDNGIYTSVFFGSLISYKTLCLALILLVTSVLTPLTGFILKKFFKKRKA